MRGLLFRSKYRLFEEHHARLASEPRPEAARRAFERRVRQARQVQAARLVCYGGLYFSVVATVWTVAASTSSRLGGLTAIVQFVAGISSSLAILFVGGILVCTRFLGLLEVELHFYSSESRMRPISQPSQGGLT